MKAGGVEMFGFDWTGDGKESFIDDLITLDHFRLFQMFYAVYKKNKIRMNDDTIRKRLRVYVPIVREKCSSVTEHIHPHLFRHSRAMHLYQHGMDLSLVSQWLGYEQLRTTLTYAYADTNHKRTAIEKAMGTTFDKDGTIKPSRQRLCEDAP